jgi:SPOR domain
MEWSDFSGSDLTRANDALTPLKLGNKLSSRPIEYSSGFWVYLPPLKDKAAIAKKLEQLKARGVSEYFVVAEAGEWQHAISLGVFKSEESAQNYLTILKDSGVNSAKVGERASKLKATIFVFKQVDEALVEQLKTLQKDFPSSELKSVECR